MKRWVNLLGVAFGLSLCACGGGNGKAQGAGPVPDTTAPTVVSVTPANGQSNIAVVTTVSVNFSEAVDCGTVTNATLALELDGAAIQGVVSCAGSTASFTPQSPLTAGAAVRVQVAPSIRDPAGNRLSGAFTSTFTTAAAPSPASYRVSGTVTGLDSGRGLVLEINGAAALSLTSNGTFAFSSPLADGAAYNVTIAVQPYGEDCVLANATGIVRAANVGDLTVRCDAVPVPMSLLALVPADAATGIAPATSIAAVFSHALDCATVTGSHVTIEANGTAVPGAVSCSGSSLSFVPDAVLAPNTLYTVVIADVRAANGATVTGSVRSQFTTGSAATGAANHAVGGTLTGLAAGRGVTLQLNASSPLAITSTGQFAFASRLTEGAAFQVSVLTQPADQMCVVSRGSGVVASADVVDVSVSCTTVTYTVSAVLSGLAAGRTITLRNDGGDETIFTSNGALTFRTPLPSMSLYDVTVSAQPPGQTCTVTRGRGQVAAANVSGIAIDCVDDRYTVSVTLGGLRAGGRVSLSNRGIDALQMDHDGTASFGADLGYGETYDVGIVTPPQFQTCAVSNGSGVVRGNVVDVTVTCAPAVAPSASALTVAFGLKQIRFSWPAADDATYYRVLSTPDGVAPYAQLGGDIAGTRTAVDVSVHLTDWVNARFRVDACNPIGCTPSAPVDAVSGIAAAVGYFKAPNADPNDSFGFTTALSADGRTLAVGAPNEASGATGVNGDGSNNDRDFSGAVYVFTRGVGGLGDVSNGWRLQAYLKSSTGTFEELFGFALDLSADGSVLAVGAPLESGCTTEVGNEVSAFSCGLRGAVHVFERSGDTWRKRAYIKGRRPNNDSGTEHWMFGESIALDASGETLVVGAPFDDSARAEIVAGANPLGLADHSRPGAGAAYVFTRTRDAWLQEAYLKAANNSANDVVMRMYGVAVAISGDGDTIAVGAPGESGGTSVVVNGDAAYNCLTAVNCSVGSGAVYVLRRTRSNGAVRWGQEAYLKAFNIPDIHFGGAWNSPNWVSPWFPSGQLSLDDRGDTLAVAIPYLQVTYLFSRSSGSWSSQALVSSPTVTTNVLTGAPNNMVALSADGTLLAISGDDRVSMYRRTGALWLPSTSGIRPPAGTLGDAFGTSLAMSADGSTVAVGARYEYGGATTIQGDQSDRSKPTSGAVYVY